MPNTRSVRMSVINGIYIPVLLFLLIAVSGFLLPDSLVRTLVTSGAALLLGADALVLYRSYRKKLTEYDSVIFGRICGDERLNAAADSPPAILQAHMTSCQNSRVQTSRIIRENEGHTRKFAVEMKDSVYLVTSINGSVQSINQKIESLNSSLLNSSSAIEEISQTIVEFSRQIENQSSSVVQTSAAVEQMDASINNVREITGRKSDAARELEKLTDKSQEQMFEMNQLIEQVHSSVDSIQDIITVINNIASQTNLLSMNAAIEAAHAGDAGKGFAVVAEEIRKLAESTSSNSALISNTLEAIIGNVGQVKNAGQEAMEGYERISGETRGMVKAFEEISMATSELNVGSHEIVEATQVLNNITSHIRDGSHEISQSARDIRNSIEQIVGVSGESTREVSNIAAIAQDINMMFMSISNAVINYETYLEQIQEFQKFEFGEGSGRLPVVKIILQHLLWILKARAVIDGKLKINAESLSDHTTCALGRWILSEAGTDLKALPVFRLMESEHEKLHHSVNRIIRDLESLERETLEERYGELLGISEQVIAALLELGEKSAS